METDQDLSGRLGMLDEHGGRRFIIPAEVKGFFHSLKKNVHFVLICFFLILPWLSVNNKQLLLLNIPRRQFIFFGVELFAHDAPLIFFLILAFAMALALATVLFGRVWCGWVCPQTVFIEMVYRQIEKWVEGNYIERRKLYLEELSFSKLKKTGLKWCLYFVVSSLIAHSFIAYFTGSKELVMMMQGAPADHLTYFVLVLSVTALLLFNFGWFREQFCVIMCPYGKFQSVLMDNQTVTIMYDVKRGEPRKGLSSDQAKKGDCVSCNRCVQVCPTKIDIRNGFQLECIACTACIDACDDIMTKLKKPKGLIRYKAFTEKPVYWLRSRVVLYLSIFLLSTGSFISTLAFSTPLRVEWIRPRTAPFQIRNNMNDKVIENQFILRVENHGSDELFRLETANDVRIVIPENPFFVLRGQKKDFPVFFEFHSRNLNHGRLKIYLKMLNDKDGKIVDSREVVLLGPSE